MKGKFWLFMLAAVLSAGFMAQAALGQVSAQPTSGGEVRDFARYEVYGGVDYSSANQVKGSSALIGFQAGGDAKLKKWFGGAVDYGWYSNSHGVAKPMMTTFLAGPELYIPSETLTGFIHVLFGIAHTDYPGEEPDISFAYAVGGGLQYQIKTKWAVRVSGDGVVSSFVLDPNNQGFTAHARVNPRAMAGIAYRF